MLFRSGGFSTGANLVTEYAYANDDIAGLVLFSPAFKSDVPLDWLAPLLARFRPWLLAPDGRAPLQTEVRYLTVPTNGFAQFSHSSQAVRRRLDERPFGKPIFMVVARHDSVLDAGYLLETFRERFPHPASRLIWYGEAPAMPGDETRILVRGDRLPDWRISQFSHMGILFSPANRLYGARGISRICWNGQDAAAMQACERGAEVSDPLARHQRIGEAGGEGVRGIHRLTGEREILAEPSGRVRQQPRAADVRGEADALLGPLVRLHLRHVTPLRVNWWSVGQA